jgi:hypothetical protein
MKSVWIAMILAAAASGAKKSKPDVMVYLCAGTESVGVVRLAEGQAERMLAAAGIKVAWRVGMPHHRGRAEEIEAVLVNQPDPQFMPGALAFARLGVDSGTRVEIFYNRIRGEMGDVAVRPILAHVLVHEITHILEGVNRHSESGVMKAHWEVKEFSEMRFPGLPFADEDLRLLHAWAARSRYSSAVK